MSAVEKSIDSSFEIVTPENIAFQYRIAGPFRRIGAWIIDYIFKLLIMLGLFLLVMLFVTITSSFIWAAIFFVGWFLVSWFYGGLFESLWNGQSPGKRIVGLRVVGVHGQPINAWQAFLRNILREIDLAPMIPYGYLFAWLSFQELPPNIKQLPIPMGLVGLITCAVSTRYQRLGDLASATMVILEERPYVFGLSMLKDINARQAAMDLPLDLRVNRRMAKALAKFIERRQMFTPQRRAELARRLGAPLRARYQIPQGMDDDALLCGMYYRTFIGEKDEALTPPSSANSFPNFT